MDDRLTALISDVTNERLFAWTDPKMVGRAYGYLDKVEGITFVDGQGIVARVHGTSDYYTRVFVGGDGDFDSVCSCPVGHRCKHAVAVILNASKKIKDGGCIAENAADCEIWKAAESSLAAARDKIEERERKILEQRQSKEREEEESRQRIEVGDSMRARLDDEAFVEKCGYHALCGTVGDACDAYWRAGCGEDAFALRKRFAAKTDSWDSCADDLCRLGRRDDAKDFLLEAREFVRSPENEEWDDGHDLIDKLAEIYAGEGNFAYAAALLAENWLSLVGGIDHCSDQYGLERILDMAGKAGRRQEVFRALAHEVDTGFPLRTKMCKNWHEPTSEPPTWPLPPTGLNLGIHKPLFSIDTHWWEAEAVLIRVAIKEGLLEEAAHRYKFLPSRPGGYFGVSREDLLTDFDRAVQKALAGKYPEVAVKIVATQEFRSWTSNHRGEKMPNEIKDRLYPLMNGGLVHSDVGRGHFVGGKMTGVV